MNLENHIEIVKELLMNKSKIAIINGILFYKNKFIKGNLLVEGKKIKKIIIGSIEDIEAALRDLHVNLRLKGQGKYCRW